ncbi:MAG: Gfo/Idh/MocA family oxidoreductase [Niabella sp.]
MENSRRDFLKKVSLLSGVTASLPLLGSAAIIDQGFNMSGYRAPKIDKVKVAFVGLGNRGKAAVSRFLYIEDVEIVALCDKYADRVSSQQKKVTDAGGKKPRSYSGEDGWENMLKEVKIDLVYICTPWRLHAPMSIASMKAGAHVGCEVPIALNLKDLWELVHTSEATRKHCMMLENCCYDFFELLTLNMVQKGVFGELVHAEGAYIHDLIDYNFSKTVLTDFWRLKENIRIHGNMYPTHGIGPVAQCMNINRGDRMKSLFNMESDDFIMDAKARELAATDSEYQPFAGKKYRGNMNTTLIRTAKGKTIMIQHDVSSPRPYSRLHTLSGTIGFAQKYPVEGMAFKNYKNGHEFLPKTELEKLEKEYAPEIVRFIGEQARKVGGHGGMDFMMDWRLVDCLRNGLPMDQDVYDAAAWSAIIPMSMESAEYNRMVSFPDFTRGNWISNTPVNLSLEGAGNTRIRAIKGSSDQLDV